MPPVGDRVDGIGWAEVGRGLDEVGSAPVGELLTASECAALVGLQSDADRFRSTIDMARHRFGEGEYRYFDYPLPELVDGLRSAFWPRLLTIAREWAGRRNRPAPWPDEFDEWLEHCHAAGQTRPTPLLLRYGPGDWNALHRDLYGELTFPLQVVIGLNEPGTDYTGGEVVLVEQRPRAQSRATVLVIPRGHGIVITNAERPTRTKRGWASSSMRHGVSTVHSGQRHTLGLIFHDAR